jgi:hypothetical protein
MSSLTPTHATRGRRCLAAALASAALLAAAPAAASAHAPIRLHFQKQCNNVGSCTGTLLTPSGRPIVGTQVSATVALPPLWNANGVLGFSATETITAANGSFTMNHLGINNLNATPDAITVLGAVVTGSWNGVPLAGATVFSRAYGGDSLPSIRGTLWIQPPRNEE